MRFAIVPALTSLVLVGCFEVDPGEEFGDCLVGTEVETLATCLDRGEGPDACVAALTAPLCDSDWDGLGDDLELALARAYGPVFAFNSGNYEGNPETNWPASAKFFVERSRLVHRAEGEDPPGRVSIESPTLATLAGGKAKTADGVTVFASNPAEGQGADFWLCLKEEEPSDETRVATKQVMLGLGDGVDLAVVAHPANGRFQPSSHVFVSFGLFFPYNEFAIVDDHEGDWESVGIFVNRETGKVDAAFFGRHPTHDPVQFVERSHGVFDPGAASAPYPEIDEGDSAPHGLRFWDHDGAQHHLVAYVSTGSHAMYDYPGWTHVEVPMVGDYISIRDTHDGELDKLLTWSGQLVQSWGQSSGDAVKLNVVNPGEPTRLTLPWANYRGQWGCDDEPVAKSWPGPFGNARHPRPELERAWGTPPEGP